MASKIKGLTVEIDGNVSPLNKALGEVNSTSRELQTELRGVERLLKLDPTNTELLAQKQKILSESVETTTDKLNKLKQAEKQVQEQFEKGEVTEDQYRELQREIIKTETELSKLEKSTKEFKTSMSNSLKDAGKSMQDFGDKVSGAGEAFMPVSVGAAGILTGLVANVELTKEYREEMGKLETAFTTSGHTAEEAKDVYEGFYAILGEEDRSVEAVSHLAKLTDSQEDLAKWTDIAAGVYGSFGDSLPIEGLTEAANETAKTGELTGVLADALNWAGVSEDDFQAKLEATNTEKERSELITETLNGLYSESADKYREVNAETIKANESQGKMNDSMATLGEVMQPLITEVMTVLADKLQVITDWISNLDEGTLKMILSVIAIVAAIGPLLVIIGHVISAVGVITSALPALGAAFAVLTGPIGWIVGAVVALIAIFVALYKNNEEFRTKINELWEGIKVFFSETMEAIKVVVDTVLKGIHEFWLENGEQIKEVVSKMFEVISVIFETVLNSIKEKVEFFIKVVKGFWDLFGEDIIRIVSSLWETAKKIFSGALKVISGILDVFIGLFTGDWDKMKEGIVKIFSGMWDIIKAYIGGAWDLIKGNFASLKEKIVGWFTGLKDSAVDWGKNMIQGFIDGILSMVDKVKNAASGVIKGAKDFIGFNSPAKKGEGKNIVKWGYNMVDGFIEGMEQAMPELELSASKLIPSQQLSNTKTSQNTISQNQEITVNTPIYLDGKQIATTTSRVQLQKNKGKARALGVMP